MVMFEENNVVIMIYYLYVIVLNFVMEFNYIFDVIMFV